MSYAYSSRCGGDETLDLDAELVAGVYQRVEEVLPGGPLAVQQVRALPALVVAHDVGHELRDRAAEGRTVGRDLLGEVNAADFRQQVDRSRARDPHQCPPVRS